jgi:RNA polymerase sigma-70 factor (ECF subfamily)
VVGQFADDIAAGDSDAIVALLTGDAWLKMPPRPFEYQGAVAIGDFLEDRAVRRGARSRPAARSRQPAAWPWSTACEPGCSLPRPSAVGGV